jgi:hypothetical protein
LTPKASSTTCVVQLGRPTRIPSGLCKYNPQLRLASNTTTNQYPKWKFSKFLHLLQLLHGFEIDGRHRGLFWRENKFVCSLLVPEIMRNANLGTRRDHQPRSSPPFASWTTYFNFDLFLNPVQALACRSARATDIKIPGVPYRWNTIGGPRRMVKDLDVIKFDRFTWNIFPGALELVQQSGGIQNQPLTKYSKALTHI